MTSLENPPTAFISYSWDNDAHKEWVKTFATRLRADGIDVTLDQWHLVPGDQLPRFMEAAIQNNQFVLIMCTSNYKLKSENRVGGVGYEGDIIASELFVHQNQRKYIPILRSDNSTDAIPIWLQGKYYIGLQSDPYSENNYRELLLTLKGQRPIPPPIGHTGRLTSESETKEEIVSQWEPITIRGVILEEVTQPKNDGTRGSALYKVPLQLSRIPPPVWGELFVRNWKNPPTWTSRHRSDIASVRRDKVILDGTTIEEIEEVHIRTLKLIVETTNSQMAKILEDTHKKNDDKKKQEEAHKKNLKNISDRLKFD